MKSHTFVLFEKDFAFIFSDNLTEKYFKSQGKKITVLPNTTEK